MLSNMIATVSAVLALASSVAAQTSTSCNPTNTTCPADTGLDSKYFTSDFTESENSSWDAAAYTTITYSDLGAAFTINTKNDAPTIATDFYIFFGYIEVKMRAAPGTGIVSSIVLESDDLDEVDWEFLGGDPSNVQTNFFGKGNTTSYNRMVQYPVTDTTTTYHTYAVNWTSSSLTWLIDGVAVRTLAYTDALALGGKNYPQTPCKLKLGSWAGGASSNAGTVTWAGGATDFSQAPFTMYVDSVSITNYNPGSQYSYSDESGDWTSIEIDGASMATNSTTASNSTSSASGTTATVAPISSVVATAVAGSNSSASSSTSSGAAGTTSPAYATSINVASTLVDTTFSSKVACALVGVMALAFVL